LGERALYAPSQLKSLQGQLFDYAQEYQKMYCWVYDVNQAISPREFNQFKSNLKKMGLKNVEIIKRP